MMLLTFFAPGFGWHAHATHEEIAHGSANVAAHHHDHESDAADHHDDAHTTIGHLLAHMPASLSNITTLPVVAPPSSDFVELHVLWPRISPDPPLRPPRLS